MKWLLRVFIVFIITMIIVSCSDMQQTYPNPGLSLPGATPKTSTVFSTVNPVDDATIASIVVIAFFNNDITTLKYYTKDDTDTTEIVINIFRKDYDIDTFKIVGTPKLISPPVSATNGNMIYQMYAPVIKPNGMTGTYEVDVSINPKNHRVMSVVPETIT